MRSPRPDGLQGHGDTHRARVNTSPGQRQQRPGRPRFITYAKRVPWSPRLKVALSHGYRRFLPLSRCGRLTHPEPSRRRSRVARRQIAHGRGESGRCRRQGVEEESSVDACSSRTDQRPAGRCIVTAQVRSPSPAPQRASNRATVNGNRHPGGAITCNGCRNWRTGLGAAHCSSCHQTFTGVSAFEMHRASSHAGGTRHRLDPATVRSERTGEPLLVSADKPWVGWSRPGTWRGPDE
jgi:hypothetical protein